MPSLAVLLFVAFQELAPFPPTPFDRVLPLVLDASDAQLEGHGHSERIEYTAEFSGTLHVWTRAAEELDLFLRVETPDGALVAEDDASGGGTTPYVVLAVELGRELVVHVALSQGDGGGELELHAIAAPESDATRVAAEEALEPIAEVQRLRAAGELEAARTIAVETLDALIAVPGSGVSELVCQRLWELGIETYGLSVLRPTQLAWSHAHRHRVRTLPNHHPDLAHARGNLAATMYKQGDLAGARALFEQVLEAFSRTLPDDHSDLARVRLNLASTIKQQGDLAGARALFEQVLEVRSRTLHADHPDLARARGTLAATMLVQGDLAGARALQEQVLEVLARTLPDDHPDLTSARQGLALTIKKQGDLAGARALEEQVLEVLARTLPDDHPDLAYARGNLAATINKQGDLAGARALQEQVLEVFARTLPDDHPDLAWARQSLAGTIVEQGDLPGARALQEQALEVLARTLPDDHPDLVDTRQGLAAMIRLQGDLAGARALLEQVLAVRSRTLPNDHPDLAQARQNLAVTIREQGGLAGARALEEQVLEVRSRTLPDDHPDLAKARMNLAATIQQQGDLVGARALQEQVLEVFSRTLPDDHPDLAMARQGLAGTMLMQGDLAGARAVFEQVLEVRSRTLPDDHPDLAMARQNLAVTMYKQGDLAGARALLEEVLEVRSHTLPNDHPDLASARGNLALTMHVQGDLAGARALEETVLAVRSRTLPDDHPDLAIARQNLAATIREQGDLAGARALEEVVLAVRSRTLPDDHPALAMARENLAGTMCAQGDLAGARALLEQVLEVRSGTLPDDHPDVAIARQNLAATMCAQGDLAGARALFEQVLDVFSRTLHDEHPDLANARRNLAVTIVAQSALAWKERRGEREREREEQESRARCAVLVRALCRSEAARARATLLTSSAREAEERCTGFLENLATALSFAQGYGVFEPLEELERESFSLSETTRGVALTSSDIARRAADKPDYARLRAELSEASDELAALAQKKGTTSEEYHLARTRREEAERALVLLTRDLRGGSVEGLDVDVDALGALLGERDALISFRSYTRWSIDATAPSRVAQDEAFAPESIEERSVESLCAFVVRQGATELTSAASRTSLSIVQLGAIDAIESVVRDWREAIGAGLERGVGVGGADEARARAEELRRVLWDPLIASLGSAERVVVALDDIVHLVPLDALPLDMTDGENGRQQLVGDRWRIETRATLTELLGGRPAIDEGVALVAFGGASFNSEPVELAAEDLAALEAGVLGDGAQGHAVAGILRDSPWERGFPPLANAADEARGVGALYAEVFEEDRPMLVLEKRKASRAALDELAPRARFLHVATHGWFAPESIKSWTDPEPLDVYSGLALRRSGEAEVRGMSPMLLCGLALAGANLPEDALGRAPGLVTAEELSTLDLSNCELAVLSACDTNVGLRRAGQGVASLQKALQMAGARSVITSLWKVPDEATKELMLDFYRRLWVEKKPKWQALWEAKAKLRNAVDERGKPLYTTRDWAAWVLTGEPQ